MACPACGSTDYVLVSPGVAQCRGVYAQPTGAHPSGLHGPTSAPAACGHRYQVPNPNADGHCDCGMQAVGRCVECGAGTCLDHLARRPDGIRCGTHAEQLRRAEANAFGDRLADARGRIEKGCAAIEGWAPGRLPDFRRKSGGHYDHNQTRELLIPGDPCPVHGGGCQVVTSWEAGGRFSKKRYFDCGTPGWMLWHRCPLGHRDMSTLTHADSSFYVIFVDHRGNLHKGNSFHLTTAGELLDFHPIYDLPRDAQSSLLEGEARVDGVGLDTFLTDLADELDALLAGRRRHAPAACRKFSRPN